MPELRLTYTGDGVFMTANRASLAEAAFLKPGVVYNAAFSQQSSPKQSALLHAACKAAYDNQQAGPECSSWRHLKSWVLCAIGHCSEARWPAGAITPEAAHTIRQGNDLLVFTQTKSGEVIMRTAETTAGLDMEAYRDLLDKVLDKILTVFLPGVELEDLMDMIGAKKDDRGKAPGAVANSDADNDRGAKRRKGVARRNGAAGHSAGRAGKAKAPGRSGVKAGGKRKGAAGRGTKK